MKTFSLAKRLAGLNNVKSLECMLHLESRKDIMPQLVEELEIKKISFDQKKIDLECVPHPKLNSFVVGIQHGFKSVTRIHKKYNTRKEFEEGDKYSKVYCSRISSFHFISDDTRLRNIKALEKARIDKLLAEQSAIDQANKIIELARQQLVERAKLEIELEARKELRDGYLSRNRQVQMKLISKRLEVVPEIKKTGKFKGFLKKLFKARNC